jgi:hypothetical protein
VAARGKILLTTSATRAAQNSPDRSQVAVNATGERLAHLRSRWTSDNPRYVTDEGGQLAAEAVWLVVEGSVPRLGVERDLRFLVQRLHARGHSGLRERVLCAIGPDFANASSKPAPETFRTPWVTTSGIIPATTSICAKALASGFVAKQDARNRAVAVARSDESGEAVEAITLQTSA